MKINFSRSRFCVRYSADVIRRPDTWHEHDLPMMTGARNQTESRYADHLLAAVLRWIGRYEDWLCSQVEPNYRERVLDKWPQRRRYKGGIAAAEMSARWFELSTTLVQELVTS